MNKNHPPDLRELTSSALVSAVTKRQPAEHATGRILMVTDFSQSATVAEKRAAMLCIERKCYPLEVMATMNTDATSARRVQHIVSLNQTGANETGDTEAGDTEAGMREVAKRLSHWEGLDYFCSIRFGNPVRSIVERVAELQPRLVVAGAYGGSISVNLARGYSTMDLVRALDCPLLVVKREPGRSYRTIVIAIDFSPCSLQAANAVIQLCPEAKLCFVHVIEPVNDAYGDDEQMSNELRLVQRIGADRAVTRRLWKLAADLGVDPSRVRCTVRRGFTPSVIDSCAKELDADLIVCGKRSDDAGGMRIGSVAMCLLVQSSCDVMVIPHAGCIKQDDDRVAA